MGLLNSGEILPSPTGECSLYILRAAASAASRITDSRSIRNIMKLPEESIAELMRS